MTIENRNLESGTRLAARYKGETHNVMPPAFDLPPQTTASQDPVEV